MGRVVHVQVAAAIGPMEIGHHPAGPFPEIGEVDHRLDFPPPHFGQGVVETLEQRRIVVGAAIAEGRDGYRSSQRRGLRTAEKTDVADADLAHPVELPLQPVTISVGCVGAEIGGVPHVGAGIAIGSPVELERLTGAGHESTTSGRVLGPADTARAGSEQRGAACEDRSSCQHDGRPLPQITNCAWSRLRAGSPAGRRACRESAQRPLRRSRRRARARRRDA